MLSLAAYPDRTAPGICGNLPRSVGPDEDGRRASRERSFFLSIEHSGLRHERDSLNIGGGRNSPYVTRADLEWKDL